jgi:hypothetical protein
MVMANMIIYLPDGDIHEVPILDNFNYPKDSFLYNTGIKMWYQRKLLYVGTKNEQFYWVPIDYKDVPGHIKLLHMVAS